MIQLSNTYEDERIQEAGECRAARGVPFDFHAELFVEHSMAEVWSCFSNLARWSAWSPICRGSRLVHPGELGLGSVLEIRLQVVGMILTVPARVVQFKPPELMTWQAEIFGISAQHTYRFIALNHGTLLCNHETLSGAPFPLDRLIRAWFLLGRISSESLKGLRAEIRGQVRLGVRSRSSEFKL